MPSQEDPTLFEIRESHLDTGLRGLPVGTCLTSAVDKDKGVSYCGYAIDELSRLSSEAVIHLLLEKRLPDPKEEAAFAAELRRRGALPDGVLEMLAQLPKRAHPMEWFVAGILYLGMSDKSGDFREDGLNLIARISGVAAAVFRLREGWGEPIAPDASLGYGENFAHMLGAPGASAHLGELLQVFHVLHMDHGGGNLSTFTGKAVASGHADIYVSMAAAMAALYGPLHGRANQECLELVREVNSSDPAEVEAFVRKRLSDGGKIFGFGHAVLRAEDPRAKVQYAFGEKHFAKDDLVRTALALRTVVPKVLKESPKIQNPYPNVDAVSGSLLCAAGLRVPEYFTVLFGWSRVAGIAAQIIDERSVMRGGRGVPIYRPRYIAVDQPERRIPEADN
jgi:citrate synthase